MSKITIAIDGWSACGKSTLAKSLAEKLSYTFVDTGSMYRCVTYYCLAHGIEHTDTDQIKIALNNISIDWQIKEGEKQTLLNGENVTTAIRSKTVNAAVSLFSTVAIIRHQLVAWQQALGEKGGVVMDGRDIGTAVFPNAELKLFVTATPEIRALRRLDEIRSRGDQNTSLQEVEDNLKQRDFIDSTRKESPLTKAKDAILLDTTKLTREEQLNIVLGWVNEKKCCHESTQFAQ